jgi:glycosyltransferase involved in cell wall biosynthesis
MPSHVDLSVVIPVYNGQPFISDAIDSVLSQTGFSIEVIVVDNNSTDGTRQLVSDRYGSAVILVVETRPSAARARNAGCHLASGNWLAFLDADDIWLPRKLWRQSEEWKKQPEIDLLFTQGQEFHSPELDERERERLASRPEPYPLLTPSSVLMKRETFMKVGDFPEVPSGEFIAWLGWAREMGLREFVLPEVLVRRRIHCHNSTRAGSGIAGYTLAARWLIEKRRGKEISNGNPKL